tara:strand:+ start:2446 stop:2910 length:465 start_codon:yes stop_codon:yes gene_type:complete
MEIILLEKISNLGDIGQKIKVKDGYARNYLLPKKIAVRATEANKKIFDEKKEELQKANKEKIKIAEENLKLLPSSIILYREASEQGALFGSVSSRDIAKDINSLKKVELNAKDILIKNTIKELGKFNINVILHAEVIGKIEVEVKSIEEKNKLL